MTPRSVCLVDVVLTLSVVGPSGWKEGSLQRSTGARLSFLVLNENESVFYSHRQARAFPGATDVASRPGVRILSLGN